MNKKIVCAKDIVLWVAALLFLIAAISLFAFSPKVIVHYLEYAGKGEYELGAMDGTTYALNIFGKTEIQWTKIPFIGDLPETAFNPKKSGDPTVPKVLVIEGTPLFLIAAICLLVAALGIVGFTFLKPCKGRTWGFILFFIMGLTGSILFLIASAVLNNQVVMSVYNYKVTWYQDDVRIVSDDIVSYWTDHGFIWEEGKSYVAYKRIDGSTNLLKTTETDGGALTMVLPYFGFVIALVGTCLRSPKIARGIVEEPKKEEAAPEAPKE